jgi:hypothetical protein
MTKVIANCGQLIPLPFPRQPFLTTIFVSKTTVIVNYTSGTSYRNSTSGAWTKITKPAEQLAYIDKDGDGSDGFKSLFAPVACGFDTVQLASSSRLDRAGQNDHDWQNRRCSSGRGISG